MTYLCTINITILYLFFLHSLIHFLYSLSLLRLLPAFFNTLQTHELLSFALYTFQSCTYLVCILWPITQFLYTFFIYFIFLRLLPAFFNLLQTHGLFLHQSSTYRVYILQLITHCPYSVFMVYVLCLHSSTHDKHMITFLLHCTRNHNLALSTFFNQLLIFFSLFLVCLLPAFSDPFPLPFTAAHFLTL